jgi:hypothetical protein
MAVTVAVIVLVRLIMRCLLVVSGTPLTDRVDESEDAEDYEDAAGEEEPGAHGLLDVVEEGVTDGDPQHGTTDEDEDDRLNVAPHVSNHHPTRMLKSTARMKVAGAKRVANLLLKVPT